MNDNFTSSSYFKSPKLKDVNYKVPEFKMPEFFTPASDIDNPTLNSLQSQKDNLSKRLQAVGVNAETPDEIDNRNIIERALNLTPDQGLLMDIFEVIDRPVQMTKGLITDGLGGAWEGLSGQEEMSGIDFLEETGLIGDADNLEGFGKFLANVGTDIALDPITYIAPIKLLKQTGIFKKKTYEVIKKSSLALENEIDTAVKEGLETTGKGVYKAKRGTRTFLSEDAFKKQFPDEVASHNGVRTYKTRTKGQVIDEAKILNDPKKIAKAEEIKVREGVAERLGQISKKYSDNFVVVSNQADDVLVDIQIYYKKTLASGETIYASVNNLEVKAMFGPKLTAAGKIAKEGKRAAGQSFTTATLKGGKLRLTGTGKGGVSKWSRDLQKAITDQLQSPRLKSIWAKIERISEGKQEYLSLPGPRAKATKEYLTKAETEQLAPVLRKAWRDTFDSDYIMGVVDGQVRAFDADEIIEKALIEPVIMLNKSGTIRWRPFIGKNIGDLTLDGIPGIDINDLTDMTDDLFGKLIEEKSIEVVKETVQKGLVGRVLDHRMFAQNKLLAEPVRLAKRAYTSVAFAFNAKMGTSKTFQGALRRIGGKQAQQMHEQTTKILRLKKELLAKNSNASKLTHEIAEAVGERANGVIKLVNRKYTGYDILDSVYQLMARGNTPFVPQIADDALAKNIVNQLNDLLDYKDLKVTLKKTKSGLNEVIVDGNIRDLADALKANDGQLKNMSLNFGQKKVSDAALSLYKNNFKQIDELLKVQDDMAKLLVKELGYENLPDVLKQQVGYIRHYMTNSAKKSLRGLTPFQDADWIMAGTDALKKRTFLGTADEINAGLKEFYGLDFDVIGTDAFVAVEELVRTTMTKLEQSQTLDLILRQADEGATPMLQAIDNTKNAMDTLGPEFVAMPQGFKGEFSNMYKNLSPKSQNILDNHLKLIGLTEGKALVMNRSAYNIMKKVNRAYLELPAIVQGYDKFLNQWKGVTLISPGFHLRNAFGNSFNQYAAGMNVLDIGRYNMRASENLIRFNQLGQTVLEGGFDTLSKADQNAYLRVLDYFEDGISQSRKGVRDLEKLKETVITAKGAERAKAVQSYQKLLAVNFNVAERMDDVQRYALYEWALDTQTDDLVRRLKAEGASEKVIKQANRNKAGEIVEEALFDYQSLTSFEKEYMKRLFPFYTFMKNNFIFQMKAMVRNPKAYARLGRAYDYWNEDVAGIPTDEMPKYMQDNMWLPIPMIVKKDDKDAINYLKLNLTPSDFAEIVENPLKRGIESISAPIKIPLEIGMGVDSFTSRPLTDFPGQTKKMQAGEGALAFMRDERGNLAVFNNPVFRKTMDDFGLRVPRNYLSISLDLFDSLGGYQAPGEFATDLSQRFSLTGAQTKESMALTELYQDLEQLRNLRSLYEQETGEKLPTLDELGFGD